jgi:hypothetical protein
MGATVMALYPDTSCFYRAEVLASPSDMHPAGRVSLFYSCEVYYPLTLTQSGLLRELNRNLCTNSSLRTTVTRNIPCQPNWSLNGPVNFVSEPA